MCIRDRCIHADIRLLIKAVFSGSSGFVNKNKRYPCIDTCLLYTSSDEASDKIPSSDREFALARELESELKEQMCIRDRVDRIYLNFSDPWPKDRHARRRLTSSEFLARYDCLLCQTVAYSTATHFHILASGSKYRPCLLYTSCCHADRTDCRVYLKQYIVLSLIHI